MHKENRELLQKISFLEEKLARLSRSLKQEPEEEEEEEKEEEQKEEEDDDEGEEEEEEKKKKAGDSDSQTKETKSKKRAKTDARLSETQEEHLPPESLSGAGAAVPWLPKRPRRKSKSLVIYSSIVPEPWLATVWKKYRHKPISLVTVPLQTGATKDGPFLMMPGSSEKYPMGQLLPFTLQKVKVVPKLATSWLEMLCAHNLDVYIQNEYAMEHFAWYRIGK